MTPGISKIRVVNHNWGNDGLWYPVIVVFQKNHLSIQYKGDTKIKYELFRAQIMSPRQFRG